MCFEESPANRYNTIHCSESKSNNKPAQKIQQNNNSRSVEVPTDRASIRIVVRPLPRPHARSGHQILYSRHTAPRAQPLCTRSPPAGTPPHRRIQGGPPRRPHERLQAGRGGGGDTGSHTATPNILPPSKCANANKCRTMQPTKQNRTFCLHSPPSRFRPLTRCPSVSHTPGQPHRSDGIQSSSETAAPSTSG